MNYLSDVSCEYSWQIIEDAPTQETTELDEFDDLVLDANTLEVVNTVTASVLSSPIKIKPKPIIKPKTGTGDKIKKRKDVEKPDAPSKRCHYSAMQHVVEIECDASFTVEDVKTIPNCDINQTQHLANTHLLERLTAELKQRGIDGLFIPVPHPVREVYKVKGPPGNDPIKAEKTAASIKRKTTDNFKRERYRWTDSECKRIKAFINNHIQAGDQGIHGNVSQ